MSKVIKKFVKNGEEYNVFSGSSTTVIEGELSNPIDARITSIRPEATPIDQISRYLEAQKVSNPVFGYNDYELEDYPTRTYLTENVAQTANTSTTILVEDPFIFNIGDLIRVIGCKAINETDFVVFSEEEAEEQGVPYDKNVGAYESNDPSVPDLILYVHNRMNMQPVVFAINGNSVTGQPIGVPSIPAGTVLVRIGNVGSIGQTYTEDQLDPDWSNYYKGQVCQKLMWALPMSTILKLSSENQNIALSDADKFLISTIRLDIEKAFLFSDRGYTQHPFNDGDPLLSTKGIWWQAGKDFEVGNYDDEEGRTIVTDNDIIYMFRDIFVSSGNTEGKRKVLLCGSDFLACLIENRGDKYSMKDTVEMWGIKFKVLKTIFGELLVAYDKTFDIIGMSDCAFAFDPDYLTKYTYQSLSESILDPNIQDGFGCVQEFSCLCLTNPRAHSRLRLAQS